MRLSSASQGKTHFQTTAAGPLMVFWRYQWLQPLNKPTASAGLCLCAFTSALTSLLLTQLPTACCCSDREHIKWDQLNVQTVLRRSRGAVNVSVFIRFPGSSQPGVCIYFWDGVSIWLLGQFHCQIQCLSKETLILLTYSYHSADCYVGHKIWGKSCLCLYQEN